MVWLLWAQLAAAQTPPSGPQDWWTLVQRAMVSESLDGDPATAAARYENLVHNELPAGDPALSIALYWLADARYALGDLNGARSALDQCIRSGLESARCTELRTRIDLEAESVDVVPVRWTFDTPDHGFFHPRPYWDKGTLRIVQHADNSVLAWETTVTPAKDDRLIVGFRAPTPSPRVIRFRARSLELLALVELELIDVHGDAYVPLTRRQALSRDWVDITITLADILPLEAEGGPLDPADLHRLVLRDATAESGRVGRNVIELDDFEVR